MKKPKILLIEDDPTQVFLYQGKFELEGFDFIPALSGEEGLSLLKEGEKPDIILLDLLLIKIDGFEVLSRIRQDKNLRDIPVLILTNLSTKNSHKKTRELGAVDYIVKTSIVPAELVERVRKILGD